MEAVVAATQFERFDVLGHLTPAHVAVAYAARHPERVRRLVLFNLSRPAYSARTSTFDGMPDIMHTHFAEFLQLAAIRQFGWSRGATAERWVAHALRHFTPGSLERVLRQMEEIDGVSRVEDIVAPTLILVDNTRAFSWGDISDEGNRFRRSIVARIRQAELVTLKSDAPKGYAELIDEFLSAGDDAGFVPGTGMSVILFTDIADSTALTERMGDAAFRAAARTLDDRMRGAIRERDGTPVEGKLLGDGVMAVFASAARAIEAARRCLELSAQSDLQLHLGIHAGDVIREQDNVYGGAVNIAARICALSRPGEILVSGTIRDLARTSAGVTFEDRGEHALKGIDDPVRVWAVR
jgi:class 3 adenylate cyclase